MEDPAKEQEASIGDPAAQPRSEAVSVATRAGRSAGPDNKHAKRSATKRRLTKGADGVEAPGGGREAAPFFVSHTCKLEAMAGRTEG